jgi:hypothetical protein
MSSIMSILFASNTILSIITLWSLTESLILYTNIYKTFANITEINQNNLKFYILRQRCDYKSEFICDGFCSNYEKFKYYEIWCDCLTNKCNFFQQEITQSYLTRIYIGWGLFASVLLIVISIIIYICGLKDAKETIKNAYRCISCIIFVTCLIFFSIGFVYANGPLY